MCRSSNDISITRCFLDQPNLRPNRVKTFKKMPGITLRFDEYDGLFCYRLLQANAPHSSRQSCLRDPRVSVVTVPRADPKGPRVVGEAGGPSKSPWCTPPGLQLDTPWHSFLPTTSTTRPRPLHQTFPSPPLVHKMLCIQFIKKPASYNQLSKKEQNKDAVISVPHSKYFSIGEGSSDTGWFDGKLFIIQCCFVSDIC